MSKPTQRKGARKRPQEGDVVACKIPEKGWLFGRVISTDAHADSYGSWTGLNLLYVFRYIRHELVPPRPLLTADLLFPPVVVDREAWTRGFLGVVESRPFDKGERLQIHCFRNNVTFTRERYFDELGRELQERIEPCGVQGLVTMHGLENLIRKHLGLAASESESPRPFTASPPRDAEHCLTFYIPSGNGLQELDVGELERELTEAVGASKAGEWAGHGTDLEMGIFDMRFVGKSTARMLDAIRPVLRRWRHSLPAGWHLTDHTDYTDPQRLTLNLE